MIRAFKKVFSENYIALITILAPAFLLVDYNNLKFMDYFYIATVIMVLLSFLYYVTMNYRHEELKKVLMERKKERILLEER
ncbi:hypothetical protein [Bacillus sp. FSL R12-0074]|uniref:hypothetical protein n=1 Tax=Bacillus sp. FSL R12-0074 TaxID=2954664 RepID=UPI0030FC9E11